MLYSFYLFIIPLLVICVYIVVKFYMHKEEIEHLGTNAFLEQDDLENNLEVVEEKVFGYLRNIKDNITTFFKFSFHYILHFIVILLKFISNFTDILYAKSRDFFLQTATKEKEIVSKFWPHLKEYKKEKEEEENKEE